MASTINLHSIPFVTRGYTPAYQNADGINARAF